MGNHNPGIANKLLIKSDLVLAVGCSLLQHQVGKDLKSLLKIQRLSLLTMILQSVKELLSNLAKD